MSGRILTIEDNPTNMELVEYLIKSAGYIFLGAANGAQGMAMIRSECPDLVVCDLQMPLVDGFGVLRQLRNDADLRHTPIVAVTALSMPGDQQNVLRAGFNGYISKPIEPERFITQLEKWLPPDKRVR
jgi:CheY-like chemotaxis protein